MFLVLLLCFISLPAIAKNTILIIGDSLSAAYGMQREQAWPALLQKKLQENNYHYTVVNASVSGDTTSNGLARLPAALANYHPDITIIELGGNDGLRGIPLNVIEKNLNAMVEAALAANSSVLILGVRLPPNYGPAYTSGFQEIFTRVAAANHVAVVPVMLQHIDENLHLFQKDGIHPTAKAQPIILSNIWTNLHQMLKERHAESS